MKSRKLPKQMTENQNISDAKPYSINQPYSIQRMSERNIFDSVDKIFER